MTPRGGGVSLALVRLSTAKAGCLVLPPNLIQLMLRELGADGTLLQKFLARLMCEDCKEEGLSLLMRSANAITRPRDGSSIILLLFAFSFH